MTTDPTPFPLETPTTKSPYKIGSKIAFEYGSGVVAGRIISCTNDNVLLKSFNGLLIYTISELERRKPVLIPERISFWKRICALFKNP